MSSARHVVACSTLAFAMAPPTALGGGDAPAKVADPPVKLRMSEYRIRIDRGHTFQRLPLFEVRNTGKVPHELVIVKTVRTAKKLPVANGQVTRHGFKDVVPLQPGEHRRIIFGNLRAGHYVLICDIPGHYQKGMRRDFTVRVR
jgi:uncharacterized cupredoxin-like copper-binding protein